MSTKIEWTDETWNPVTGCTKVSPGCDHCYAEGIAHRFAGTKAYPNGFDVTLRPERLEQPLRWTRPRMVFVNSMSDLFHRDIPDEYIARVFAVMALASQHTFQILTKRHGRMRSLLSDRWWSETLLPELIHELAAGRGYEVRYPLPNVWLGVSTEDQQRAELRIPALLDTPAAVRFISAEPLLGPIDLFSRSSIDRNPQLDWVIVGGESGPGARPMHPNWARRLRDQCAEAEIAFFLKQWGEWVPESFLKHRDNAPAAFLDADGMCRPLVNGIPTDPPRARGDAITIRRVGKKTAGRVLDGRQHTAWPKAVTA
ncbi:phage Gp37/Gp68 family protein [Phycicoccus sp. 3266]|uniref:DUF5131 family protein n=1 Tax=Phycicoccus sp. 3266 TaxID=2817751 RepID=UPI002855B6B6|nr:phage Gp37/Gp68 family protein [Phycicoccus sp. 3266]MDR6861946.1 protein gp37 [Phycicoccus sp. 3266]